MEDRIEKGDLEGQYEPIDRVWLDAVIKPKQGKAFCVFRGQLMDVPEDYDDQVECLNTHWDLLPPADDNSKLLMSNNVLLYKALGTTEKTFSSI